LPTSHHWRGEAQKANYLAFDHNLEKPKTMKVSRNNTLSQEYLNPQPIIPKATHNLPLRHTEHLLLSISSGFHQVIPSTLTTIEKSFNHFLQHASSHPCHTANIQYI
jgi:hypothetical protein